MWRYVRKRLILLIPVILGAILIIYFIMWLCPGDPASVVLGAAADEQTVYELNSKFGYYDPFFVRYFNYIKGLLQGDMGISYKTSRPVGQEIIARIPISLRTASLGVGFAALVGIPLGILTAVKQYSLFDTIPTAIAMIFAAMPLFWLGMLLMYIFALKLGWLPAYGVDTWQGLILPMLALGMPQAARLMRFTRSSMLEAIREDYVRTARAKGAKERTVIWKHALKNALLPVITVLGNTFGQMFGGTVVTEKLFSIPGIGTYMVDGIGYRDIPVVTGSVVTIAIVYSMVTLLVDLAYAFVDPRTKARFSK